MMFNVTFPPVLPLFWIYLCCWFSFHFRQFETTSSEIKIKHSTSPLIYQYILNHTNGSTSLLRSFVYLQTRFFLNFDANNVWHLKWSFFCRSKGNYILNIHWKQQYNFLCIAFIWYIIILYYVTWCHIFCLVGSMPYFVRRQVLNFMFNIWKTCKRIISRIDTTKRETR